MEDKELTQWEYKTVEAIKLNEKELNDLGKQGWETTGNNLPNGGMSEIIFKRPKKEKEQPSQGYGR